MARTGPRTDVHQSLVEMLDAWRLGFAILPLITGITRHDFPSRSTANARMDRCSSSPFSLDRADRPLALGSGCHGPGGVGKPFARSILETADPGDERGLSQPPFRPSRGPGLSGRRVGSAVRGRAARAEDLVVSRPAGDQRQAAFPRVARPDQSRQRGGPARPGLPSPVQADGPVLRLLLVQRGRQAVLGRRAVPGFPGQSASRGPRQRAADLGFGRGPVREPQRGHDRFWTRRLSVHYSGR